MKRTINIDFDNSSSVLLGYDPDILGTKASAYALSTHTHGNVLLALTNLTGAVTSVSNGLTIALRANTALGGGVVHAGSNITLSTAAGNTTVSAYGLAADTHNHGGAPSITGLIGGTIGSNAWSLSVPDFLLTAALSDHTHSNLAGNATSTVTITGTNLTLTANELGMSFGVPRWITTAANSTHTHGSFLGTNITRVSSGSGGLALSVADKIGTDTSSGTITGSTFGMTGNTSGLTLRIPNYLTTAAQVSHSHGPMTTLNLTGSELKYTSASNGLTLGMPEWITTAAVESHTHGNVSLSLSNLSGSYSSASNGLTISLTNSTHSHPFAGTSTAATNVGLTVNTDGIRVSLDTAGLTSFGDGANFLAAGGSTAASYTTIGFVNSNRVSFLLNSDSLAASIAEYVGTGFTTTATSGTAVVGTANSDGLKLGVPAFITTALVDAIKGVIVSDTTYTSGSVSFSNANNISFGSSGEGVITASISFPAQSVQPVAISDSATSFAFSTLTLGAANGLTLYHQNSSIVGSYTVPNVTSLGRVIAINGTSGSLSISASRNVSINSSEGSAFTFYGPANILNSFSIGGNTGTTGSSNITGGGFVIAGGDHITISQSNNTISLIGDAGVAIAPQGVATTFNTGLVIFSGQANVTLNTTEVGGSQYIRISAGGGTETAGADGGNILAAGSQTANSTGEVKFINSNGVTFGMSNSSEITASINAISRIVVSDSTMVSNFVSFSNANNISFGASGANVITISTGTHEHTQYVGLLTTAVTGASATLNNSQHMLNIPQGSLYYIDGGGITWGASSDNLSTSIFATVAGTGGGTGGVQLAGSGASTIDTGLVQFANANGISFGLSSNTMTASYASDAYLGTAYVNFFQATSDNSLSLANSYSSHTHGSNISWGNTTHTSETAMRASSSSNGLTIVVPPYLTAAGSHTHGASVSTATYTTGGTAATSIIFSSASNGLTMSYPAYAVTSHTHSNLYANVTHTHGNISTSSITGSVLTNSSGSAGLTLGIPAWITTAGVASHTHGNVSLATSHLLGASASSTSNGFTLSISGYPSSSFYNVSQSSRLYFQDANSITWGSSTAGSTTTITASFAGGGGGIGSFLLSGNTTGATTASGSTIRFIAGSNITLSGASNSVIRFDVADNAGNLYFTDGNGITFGVASDTNNNTTITGSVGSIYFISSSGNITWSSVSSSNSTYIYGSAPSGTGGAGNLSITVGTVSATRDAISFANANNVSFTMSGSTISGSIANNAGYLGFQDSNGILFGVASTTSNSSSVVTASYAGIWNLIQSGGSTAGTQSSSFGSILNIVAGSGITLSGGSGGITVLA